MILRCVLLFVVYLMCCACETVQKPVKTMPKEEARIELFKVLSENKECRNFSYGGGQGIAKLSYLKGLLLTYTKTVCQKGEVYKVASQELGSASIDALTHYGLKPKTEGERLSTTAALVIGANARESSWRPCVGRDVLAKPSDVKDCLNGVYNGIKYTGTGMTCEAGLSQTSCNSLNKNPVGEDIFQSFLKDDSTCFKKEYYGDITCSTANWQNHGSDPRALSYQKLSKECPAFSVESAFVMFRIKRTHYGPLNQKKAEVVPACITMFEQVRKMIEERPELCSAI